MVEVINNLQDAELTPKFNIEEILTADYELGVYKGIYRQILRSGNFKEKSAEILNKHQCSSTEEIHEKIANGTISMEETNDIQQELNDILDINQIQQIASYYYPDIFPHRQQYYPKIQYEGVVEEAPKFPDAQHIAIIATLDNGNQVYLLNQSDGHYILIDKKEAGVTDYAGFMYSNIEQQKYFLILA